MSVMLENYNIILASNSPRRRELLAGLALPFQVKTIPGLEESYPSDLKEGDIPLFLAKQKAHAYDSLMEEKTMVITADTIVWHNGEVLGKPKDRTDAIHMLQALSGDTHQVYTGVCVRTKEKEIAFVSRSDVKFAPLTDEEITFYVDHYHPFDKAGSYGVQEWIGYIAVEHINGSFYNIMGLPVQRLYKELKTAF
ncbi:MAG: septum formation protein Maf [Paludibacteraceae bacterium]|nr:septum formation protein Maf [Paludibacteraceae bacterium]